jgi:hypothetical protein
VTNGADCQSGNAMVLSFVALLRLPLPTLQELLSEQMVVVDRDSAGFGRPPGACLPVRSLPTVIGSLSP